MLTLGYRSPEGCQPGNATTLDGDLRHQIARPHGQRYISRATRPYIAGTPLNCQARGIPLQFNRNRRQPKKSMPLHSPRLIPNREYPHRGIETPVAFPREPEPNKNTCQTLRHNPDALDPEDPGAPVIVAAVTATAIEIETGTEEEMMAAKIEATAPTPTADPPVSRSRFR